MERYKTIHMSRSRLAWIMAAAKRLSNETECPSVRFDKVCSYINWVNGAWRLWHSVVVIVEGPVINRHEILGVMDMAGHMKALPGTRPEDLSKAPYIVRDFGSNQTLCMTYPDLAAIEKNTVALSNKLEYAHGLGRLNAEMSEKEDGTDEDLALSATFEPPMLLLACVSRYVEDLFDVYDEAGEPMPSANQVGEEFLTRPDGRAVDIRPTGADYARAGAFVADLCGSWKQGPDLFWQFGSHCEDHTQLVRVAVNHFYAESRKSHI